MFFLNTLSQKEKIFLTELVNKIIPELNVSARTLNSLKPGVIQFCFNNWHCRTLKKKVIEKIINKIIYPGILDGELVEEKPPELKNEN